MSKQKRKSDVLVKSPVSTFRRPVKVVVDLCASTFRSEEACMELPEHCHIISRDIGGV